LGSVNIQWARRGVSLGQKLAEEAGIHRTDQSIEKCCSNQERQHDRAETQLHNALHFDETHDFAFKQNHNYSSTASFHASEKYAVFGDFFGVESHNGAIYRFGPFQLQ
jgi:hypothetical protein